MCCSLGTRQRKRRLSLLVLIITSLAFLVAVIFFMVLPDHGRWVPFASYSCGAYCENSDECTHRMKDRSATHQPINAWTSFAYILAGLWPLVMRRADWSTILFFLSCFYTGICSFVFHASISVNWQRMDVASQYTLALCLILHGVHAVTRISWKFFSPPLFATGVGLGFLRRSERPGPDYRYPQVVEAFIWCLIVLSVLLLFERVLGIYRWEISKGEKRWKSFQTVLQLAFPALLMLVSHIFRVKDMDESWCNPSSIFQGHAVWHCLTAAAAFLIWTFFDDAIQMEDVPPVTEEEQEELEDSEVQIESRPFHLSPSEARGMDIRIDPYLYSLGIELQASDLSEAAWA